ncbi:MAG: BglG family transcription antiterminator [Clostridium sp.]|uniref:BglG family transcription antiterminator n=1 Tax=Clostridium sp. TaxID=1506 RepID=UPI003D6D0722
MNSPSAVAISYIASEFNISARTVRYDLDKIDEFLMFIKLPQLCRKQNVGISYEQADNIIHCVTEKLQKISSYQYVLSKQERIDIILSELLRKKDYITIDLLKEKLMVSRSTMVSDLEQVKKWLKDKDLKLNTQRKHGIKIVGEEKYLRRASIDLFTKNMDASAMLSEEKSAIISRASIPIHWKIKKVFADIDIEFIENCVRVVEKQLEKIFSDEAFYGLVGHIAISIRRIRLGRDIIMPYKELRTFEITKEFTAASYIAKMMEEHFSVSITIDEIGYITVHLLGSNSSVLSPVDKADWANTQILTGDILEKIGKLTKHENLLDDKQLFNAILDHLTPALYRLEHDLKVKNPVLAEIMESYEELFQIVAIGLEPIEKYAKKTFSDEEIGYFTLHFAAAMERIKETVQKVNRILVVCSTGIGTAKLLSTKIMQLYDVFIVDTVAYHKVSEVLKSAKVDLIVTTLSVEFKDIISVKVSPFLTERDVENLNKFLKPVKTYSTNMLDEILEVIHKNCEIFNYDNLVGDLSEILKIEIKQKEKGVVQPVLVELLNEKTIELNVNAKDWEESILIGGKILEDQGLIEHRYVDAMINTVKEMGPYIVIVKGIAMPHARPEAGAKGIGMALLTLKNPINFGNEENDPVKIVIFLCAIDKVSHLKALSELMQLLEDETFKELASNATDKNEIINYISTLKH